MTNFPIKTFTGSIQNQSTQLINARELHNFLQSKQHFSDWIKKRIADYGFAENLDFIGIHKKMITEAGLFGKREKVVLDYHITLDMAKELCMLERSELGRQARRYFIEKEKQALALSVEVQKQLLAIPPFLRGNPDELARLIGLAQTTFSTVYPEARDICRYREMGLSYAEMGKLLNLTSRQIELRISKMIRLGFFKAKATAGTQLALAM